LIEKLSSLDPELPVIMVHRETAQDTLLLDVVIVSVGKHSKGLGIPQGTPAAFLNETKEPYINSKVMKSILLIILISLVGCTENARARAGGGHMNVNLPMCRRLVTATWKEADLWYLTEPMGANKPRTTTFNEISNYGINQGSVSFIEKCDEDR